MLLLPVWFLLACDAEEPTASEPEQPIQSADADSLDARLQQVEATGVLPGFAVSIFTSDSILYQKGFGFASLEKATPYTPEHVQIIASITKTLVGVASMKAIQDGLLTLEDDINSILPYKVVNPNFPDDTITVKMLASHTSSIGDTEHSDEGP